MLADGSIGSVAVSSHSYNIASLPGPLMTAALILLLTTVTPAAASGSAYALSSLKALPASKLASKTVSLRIDGARADQLAAEDDVEWQKLGLVAQVRVPEEAFTGAASRRVVDLNLRAAVDDEEIEWHKFGFVGVIRVPSQRIIEARPKRVDLSPSGIGGVVGGILGKQHSQQQQRRARRTQATARDIRFAMALGAAAKHRQGDWESHLTA
jgi:hypothetical protein